ATAETAAILGAKPVYVDIDPRTYNVDPALLEAAITPRTKAIIAVSLYGQCADFDAINPIAARHGIPVIEDAAQSFGGSYKGRKSCNLSLIGCTSFFPSKPLGCYGDGGAIFTSDDALAKAMQQIARHGQDRRYHHVRVGVNSRLDTLQAAILLVKLGILDDEIAARQRAAASYDDLLKAAGVTTTPFIEAHNVSAWAQYTVQVDHREHVQAALKEAGVPTAVHYPVPLNRKPAGRRCGREAGHELADASVHDRRAPATRRREPSRHGCQAERLGKRDGCRPLLVGRKWPGAPSVSTASRCPLIEKRRADWVIRRGTPDREACSLAFMVSLDPEPSAGDVSGCSRWQSGIVAHRRAVKPAIIWRA